MLIKTLTALVFAVLPFYTANGQNFSTVETEFTNGSVNISADVFIPVSPVETKTGIALIQGSGNSDRSNKWTRAFAEFLSSNGYYVLVPDKRGTGKSTGDWKNSSFSDLAADASASVSHLKKIYNLNRVGLMGLSQGGFIAPVSAANNPEIGFVINVSGAAVTLEEQVIFEMTNTCVNLGMKPQYIEEILKLHALMKNYSVTGNWEPLENKFNELKSSEIADFVKSFPNNKDSWLWNWAKLNMPFDPLSYWKKITVPSFTAYGEKDEKDNCPVYESIYRLEDAFTGSGNKNYIIRIYKTGHAMYEDDKPEIRNEFISDLLNWLKSL